VPGTKCWKCKDRPASRVGGLCHTCWAAAGKPDRETVEAMRSGAIPGGATPLSTDLADTLPAMRFVVSNPASADTTHQHKSMREWREASPTSFYSRLADLEKAELNGKPPAVAGSPAEYDGEAPCPTCNREPEKELPGPEFMADEFEEVLMISEHRDAILRILPHIDQFDAWLAQRAG
jgi:hypothetical protein